LTAPATESAPGQDHQKSTTFLRYLALSLSLVPYSAVGAASVVSLFAECTQKKGCAVCHPEWNTMHVIRALHNEELGTI
jgi:hypothetical protein